MSHAKSNVLGPLLVTTATIFTTWALTAGYYAPKLRQAHYFAGEAGEELAPLAARFGPARQSENFEEWAIRDFFNDRRSGVFVDVGAHHYKLMSNTYYLEKELDWSGIAIDAQPDFAADYKAHRPRTHYVALFVSNVAGETVQLFVPDANKLVASSNPDFTVKRGFPGSPRTVPTTTLNVVLDQAGVKTFDFMSMDIELSEPAALAGFDIDRFDPALICIEAHPEVRQQILDYFADHRYVLVGKYLRADSKNLYFQPARVPH